MADTPIFISYRSLEQDFALKLARDLLQAGYPVWMDRLHGILPGNEWRHSLEQGVNKAPDYPQVPTYCNIRLSKTRAK